MARIFFMRAASRAKRGSSLNDTSQTRLNSASERKGQLPPPGSSLQFEGNGQPPGTPSKRPAPLCRTMPSVPSIRFRGHIHVASVQMFDDHVDGAVDCPLIAAHDLQRIASEFLAASWIGQQLTHRPL
jgi:hypothetical protein